MKRPTRVPVSIVVRMKSASNMMRSGTQSAVRVLPTQGGGEAGKDVGDADRERGRAAGARDQRLLAHLRR